MEATGKKVLCYKCLHLYDQSKAPLVKTPRLKGLERACPNCGCKLYFS